MNRAVAGPRVGERVRIERDETRYPLRGTWPQFRGRAGTVVAINADRERPHLTEYGVVFGATRRRPNGSLAGSGTVTTWFKVHEITSALAAESDAEHSPAVPAMDDTSQTVSTTTRYPGGRRPCSCGCGRTVTDYTQECYPVAPWDTFGLPPRRMGERCAHHNHCAYRDDDPARCPRCHAIPERCKCHSARRIGTQPQPRQVKG